MDDSQKVDNSKKIGKHRWLKFALVLFVITTIMFITAPRDNGTPEKDLLIIFYTLVLSFPAGYILDKVISRSSNRNDEKFKSVTGNTWTFMTYVIFIFLLIIIGILLINYKKF